LYLPTLIDCCKRWCLHVPTGVSDICVCLQPSQANSEFSNLPLPTCPCPLLVTETIDQKMFPWFNTPELGPAELRELLMSSFKSDVLENGH
ncbi:hypothetical protein ILYODFUR_013222, partial [Ilyodon furcidens]